MQENTLFIDHIRLVLLLYKIHSKTNVKSALGQVDPITLSRAEMKKIPDPLAVIYSF